MSAMKKDLTVTRGYKMTAGHFRFIAEVIRDMPDHEATLREHKESTARAFAKALRRTNPMFKEDRFIAACLEGMHTDATPCQWFAKCGRDSTGTIAHPVLGNVPCCDRCRDFASSED